MKTTVTEIDQGVSQFIFDDWFRLVKRIYPDGATISQSWTPRSRLATQTDALGFTTKFFYDERDNLVGLQRPLDSSPLKIEYDGVFDKPVRIEPLAGAPIQFVIEPSNGDVLRVQRGDGASALQLITTRDQFGNLLSVNNGLTTYSHVRSPDGLLTTRFDLHNPETRSYDSRGRITARTFQSGRVLSYSYNDGDFVTSIVDSSGPKISLEYDDFNRIVKSTVSDGQTSQVTNYGWDERDRPISRTDALGHTTTWRYNELSGTDGTARVIDKPTSAVLPNGAASHLTYDSMLRLASITDATGATTRFEYNARGDRTAIIDANGNRSTFSYDGNDRLVQETKPVVVSSNGSTAVITQAQDLSYDAAGRLISTDKYAPGLSNAPHATATLTYDEFDRLIKKTLKTGPDVDDTSTYSYQRQLDVTNLAGATNQIEQLSFESESAPPFKNIRFGVAASDPSNGLGLTQGTFSISRDVSGEIAGIAGPSGQLFSASYDTAGRLTHLLSNFNSTSYSAELSYDGYGRKISIRHSTGLSGRVSYDLLGRTIGVLWNGFDGKNSQHMSEGLGYDPAGSITSLIRENGSYSFGYSNIGQLVSSTFNANQSVDFSSIFNRNFSFDPSGNRVNDNLNGQGMFSVNAILSDAHHLYQTDGLGFGNLAQKLNLTTSNIELYSYRGDSKLTSYMRILDVNGNHGFDPGVDGVTLSAEYAFDPLGRRVAATITQGATKFTQSYVYLADQDKALLGVAGDRSNTLVLDGQGATEHLAEIGPTGVSALMTDHVESVLNGSASSDALAFGPFGETLGVPPHVEPSASPISFGFQGMRLDPENGLYCTLNRCYDSNIGRWTTPDPIGFAGGSTNLYEAFRNNPQRYLDPDGLKIVDKTAGLIPLSVSNSPIYQRLDRDPIHLVWIVKDDGTDDYGDTAPNASGKIDDVESQLIKINPSVIRSQDDLADTITHELGHAEINVITNDMTSGTFDHKYIIPQVIRQNVNSCEK